MPTSQPSAAAVEALFDFINADGAFDSLWLTFAGNDAEASRAARKVPASQQGAKLSTFQQLVFWLSLFRLYHVGMGATQALYCVSKRSGMCIYNT